MITEFAFTPTTTTEEMRQNPRDLKKLKANKESFFLVAWRTNPLVHGQSLKQPSEGLAVIHLHQDVISKHHKG